MSNIQSLESIRKKYPNQWVLLGNPEIQDDKVGGGIVLFHDEDKKKVLVFAKKEIENYTMVKVLYTGEASKAVRLNIFKVSESRWLIPFIAIPKTI